MLRRSLLALSRSERLKRTMAAVPGSSGVVARYVPGEAAEDAVGAASGLVDRGLVVSLAHLGEDPVDRSQANQAVRTHLRLLAALAKADLTAKAEVSVKLSTLGQALPGDGHRIAFDNAHQICLAASDVGTMVTLDLEDHPATDPRLRALEVLRKDFPDTGVVLRSSLRRTEGDCRDLAYAGSRVRLCKGALDEPASVAFRDQHEVDKSYVRALKVLMAGNGYPMVATHDPRLIAIAAKLARDNRREAGAFEYQMGYGIRPHEQQRLADEGHRVRVYIPYGAGWYGYLLRRLAQQAISPRSVRHALR